MLLFTRGNAAAKLVEEVRDDGQRRVGLEALGIVERKQSLRPSLGLPLEGVDLWRAYPSGSGPGRTPWR